MGESSFLPYTLSSFQGLGIIRTYVVGQGAHGILFLLPCIAPAWLDPVTSVCF